MIMSGEKINYYILSWGEDRPETIPEEGEMIQLLVENKKKPGDKLSTDIVNLKAASVRDLGVRFVRVAGIVNLPDGTEEYGVAKYEHDQQYKIGTLVGTLVVYRD